MQITVDLPDKLTERVKDKWGNLPQKILDYLILSAFRDGLIDFEEFREMLSCRNEAEFKAFLAKSLPLHASGLLDLSGTCADIDLVVDDLGISDEMDDDLIGVFDE